MHVAANTFATQLSHTHTPHTAPKDCGTRRGHPFLQLLVVRLIYDTQAASPEIKKVKSLSKVESGKKGAKRTKSGSGSGTQKKGRQAERTQRKRRRNKGIKITDSQKDCAAITHRYTPSPTRMRVRRQKGQHHWHHMLRNLCYCHTNSYAYVCVFTYTRVGGGGVGVWRTFF